MTDIRNIKNLLNQIAAQEAKLSETQFIAPCVRGGKVRTRVAGMIYTFTPQPKKFAGWGIFQPENEKTAKLVEEADLFQIDEYLSQFPLVRLWLAYELNRQINRQTWLAYPMNESDFQQRIGLVKPVVVHLVSEGNKFDPVLGRWDGINWWFQEIDRRADPLPTEELRQQFKQMIPPEEVRFKGMTPEMHTVYELVANRHPEFNSKTQDERRLQKALKMGGGDLRQFEDKGDDYWLVEWTTSTGEHQTSAISKQDLTVVSAGICLSGGDRAFDLQSLVGVVEQRDF